MSDYQALLLTVTVYPNYHMKNRTMILLRFRLNNFEVNYEIIFFSTFPLCLVLQ